MPLSLCLAQVEELMVRSLHQWGTLLWHEKLTQMQWDKAVVAFLTDRVSDSDAVDKAVVAFLTDRVSDSDVVGQGSGGISHRQGE